MIDGVTYEVIGVLEPRKGGFVKDQSADRAVMVPYRSYHKHIPQDDEHFVGATAYPGLMSEAEDQIRGVLRRRRSVPYSKPESLHLAAAKSGVTVHELEDYAVEGYGLDPLGSVRTKVGDAQASIQLLEDGGVTVTWRNALGKDVRSAPAAIKKAFPSEVRSIIATAKELELAYRAQRIRLETSLL